jgi:phage terminase small subunit
MTKLTAKQQAFVANKVAGVANRDAAIAAGYSVAGASVAADKLMRNPAVRAAIKTATKAAPAVDTRTNAPTVLRAKYKDSMALLMDAMNCEQLPIGVRMDCAKALLPYQHAKMGEVGKKEKAKERAHAISGKRHPFAPKQPPQLRVVTNNE